jgi:hypothetical protein
VTLRHAARAVPERLGDDCKERSPRAKSSAALLGDAGFHRARTTPKPFRSGSDRYRVRR